MYYPEEVIEEIRTSSDIVDVISAYVRLEKKGGSHFGLCPFHNEKSPSFSVSRGKQMYYCFGCGAGGNVFTFIMQYENFTFVEAIKFLADRAGIKLPEIEYSKEAREKADLKAILFEINKQAARYFYMQLQSAQGQYALQYIKEREIRPEMVKVFGLGYSNQYSDDLYKYLREQGHTEELLRQAGLIQADEKQGVYDRFWNRVMFPIMDSNSRVIGFGGRVMGEGKPKYLNSPETLIFDKSRNLYGLNRARTSRRPFFFVCEGYLDVIALHQYGFTNAIATLGTALTHGHANLIKRYVNEVYLTYDSDEAGTRAALRGIPILREVGISTKIIRMEPYKDPDDFLKALGTEAFEKRITEAQNGFMFSLTVLEKAFQMTTPEGKTGFFQEVAKKLLVFEEELERSNYIEAVAKYYGIAVDSLKKLVTNTAMKENMIKPVNRPKQSYVAHPADETRPKNKTEAGLLKAQKALLTLVMEDKTFFEIVRRLVQPADFTKELYRTVAELLYAQYEKGEVNPSQILNYFSAESEHIEVASLFHSMIVQLDGPEEKKQALRETIVIVKKGSIDAQTKQLAPTDMVGLQNIMIEKRKLEEFIKES